jgi:hypothetical protein
MAEFDPQSGTSMKQQSLVPVGCRSSSIVDDDLWLSVAENLPMDPPVANTSDTVSHHGRLEST